MRIQNFLDKLLILFILPIIFPLCFFIYFLIKKDGYSPIFRQIRIGKNKVPFTLYKFRSMKPIAPEALTHECPDDFYLSSGRFIRRFKLDELPQFINVFNGSMSLVGPRPGLINDQKLIEEREKRNLYDFSPGITGYSQIMNICMDEPVKLAKFDLVTIKLKKNFFFYFLMLFATIFTSKSNFKKRITGILCKNI